MASATLDLDAARLAMAKWRADPVAFAVDVLDVTTLYDRQMEVLRSVVVNRETNAPSGHACGKDHLASVLVPWFLLTEEDSVVVTTATKALQVEKILWAEIRARVHRAKVPLGGTLLPSAASWQIGPKWYAIGITAADPNGFAGFRSNRILLVRDEAAGIAPQIWEASEALAAGPDDRILNIGNPICGPTHPFAKACAEPDSPGRNRTIRMSSTETPNYKKNNTGIKGLATRTLVETFARKYGRDSVVYAARILGKFPGSAADGLISYEHLSQARARYGDGVRPKPGSPVYLGCDPARFGDDLTVIYAVEGCHAWEVAQLAKADSRAICDAVLGAARAHKARGVAIDSTGGYGAGPVDMLREEVNRTPSMAGFAVHEVNFGSAATDKTAHANKRTELWWGMRDWIRDVAAWDGDDLIVEELLAATYKPQGTGIALEPKEGIKKRIERSPDRADALALAIYAGRAPASLFTFRAPAREPSREPDRDDHAPDRLTARSALDGAY